MVGTGHDADAPFVGRDRELGVLVAALRETGTGHARFLVVTGDAGIGKTRIVEEFVRQADLPANRVLWGRAPEQPGAPSYWPWMRAIQDYVTTADPAVLRDELGTDAAVLAHLVPAVRTRVPDVEPAPLDGEDARARFQLLGAVAGFLARAAAREPLMLALEDLHWADEA